MDYTVDVFAICYNEEFMLPHFIEHYKKNFNAHITIFDNLSTDNSAKIAREMGCDVKTYFSNDTIRDDIYLKIKNNCWKDSKADFVIVCDIDEFLELDFDPRPYTIINTKGYDMVGDITSRKGVYSQMASKHIMFSPKDIKEIAYNFGCHSCKPVGYLHGSNEFAKLLHRKYISEEYVFERHMMYEKRLSSLNKKWGWGVHYLDTTREKINEQFKKLRSEAIEI